MVEINKLRKKNVNLILLIVLIVQVNDLNYDNPPDGGCPQPPGSGWKMSEKSKSDFFYFFSVNKKYKEKTF
jgi:hypothetical protein